MVDSMTAPISGEIDLGGQTAVVTGAAGAIGAATCEALAREGAGVVAADVAEGLDETAARVETHGVPCSTVECDVTEPTAIDRLVDTAFDHADTVEIVAAVHGIVDRATLSAMTREEWARVIDVNLTGTAFVVQAFYDHLLDNGYGKVVCIGSIAGKIGGVISGANYVASKGGVHGLVKWAAQDAAEHGVYVNAIAPGPVWSPMTRDESLGYSDSMAPLGRLGEPEDIAEGVVFLASQASNWITGTVLDINGGMLMD